MEEAACGAGLGQREGEGYAVEDVRARAVALLRQCGDRGEDEVPQANDVAPELSEHFFLGDAFPLGDTRIGVGDQGKRRVAEGQLSGEDRLGIPGHADERPALRGEPSRLRPGGEPRPFDHHQRARLHRRPAGRARRADDRRPSVRAVRIRELHVHRAVGVVIGLRPAPGPVYELVGNHQRAWLISRCERTDGAGREYLAYAERAQRPQVRPVGDAVWREPVITAVAGQESDPPPGDLADHDRIARRAKRGVHHTLIAAFKQCVEPRTADHADSGFVRHGVRRPSRPRWWTFLSCPSPPSRPSLPRSRTNRTRTNRTRTSSGPPRRTSRSWKKSRTRNRSAPCPWTRWTPIPGCRCGRSPTP